MTMAFNIKPVPLPLTAINLASGLTVKLQGENSLILKTRNHGNISIGTNLNANGGDAEVTPSGYSSFPFLWYRNTWWKKWVD